MKRFIQVFPVAKSIPVILISLLLTYFLKNYHYFTFQKSYFIFIYSLFFCLYLCYSELINHYTTLDFKLFYRQYTSRIKLLVILVLFLTILSIVIELPFIKAKVKLYPSWLLDYYNIAGLTVCYQTFGFIKRG